MGPQSVKTRLKPRGHLIESRGVEILVGVVLFIVGAVVLWDAFDGRGKSLPWPVSAVLPW
jgi:hypothetical protein